MTMALPNLVPVKLTVQLAVVPLTVASVQLVGLNVPVAVLAPPSVKATVPAGVDAVPDAVSFTNAVHDDAWPTGTVDGVHTTVVVVARPPEVPVTVPLPAPLLVLAAWTASLGV